MFLFNLDCVAILTHDFEPRQKLCDCLQTIELPPGLSEFKVDTYTGPYTEYALASRYPALFAHILSQCPQLFAFRISGFTVVVIWEKDPELRWQ